MLLFSQHSLSSWRLLSESAFKIGATYAYVIISTNLQFLQISWYFQELQGAH